MVASDVGETPPDFAGRLEAAIKAEAKSPTRTGREAGLPDGYIFKLLGVSRAKQILSPGPEVIRQLADYLGVGYEWLAIGRGPMRPEGWAPSALEEAMLFARKNNAREDAILAAASKHRDETVPMTAWDWIRVFDYETRRLEDAGVPRPAAIAKQEAITKRKHAEVQRVGEVKRRQKADAAAKTAAAKREHAATHKPARHRRGTA